MKNSNKILEIISHETIVSIGSIDIVTPTIYKSIFTKCASNHNTDLKDEEKLTDNILNDKISKYQNLQEQTTKNVVKLSDHTNNAISAIQDKDESKLNKILKETQNLREEIEKLKEAVYRDELTHSFNRKWLHDNFLKNNTENLNRDGILIMIDLNYFKIINDTHGHIVGDKVLIFIANQLKKSKYDVIRYGGDEFILMCSSEVTITSALKTLNKIREDIIHKNLKNGDTSFKVSFSFGISKFKKDDTLESVIELADKSMYEDKIEIKRRVKVI